MKKIIFLLLLCFSSVQVKAQAKFVTWKTDSPGNSSSTSITIPNAGDGYNYDVSWKNEGNWEKGLKGDVTHDYGVAGAYMVAIRGSFPRTPFTDSGDHQKILSIEQSGVKAWSSINSAFRDCVKLVGTAADTRSFLGLSISPLGSLIVP